jgi:hypothetical protein
LGGGRKIQKFALGAEMASYGPAYRFQTQHDLPGFSQSDYFKNSATLRKKADRKGKIKLFHIFLNN